MAPPSSFSSSAVAPSRSLPSTPSHTVTTLPGGDELLGHRAGHVDRDGEAEALGPGVADGQGGGDADDPAVASSRAPPEEPGAIGASVCTMSTRLWPVRVRTERCRALTTPTVTDGPPLRPRGDPMAMAFWPTLRSAAVPRSATGKGPPSIFTTAVSVSASAPTTRAATSRPVERTTVTGWRPRRRGRW